MPKMPTTYKTVREPRWLNSFDRGLWMRFRMSLADREVGQIELNRFIATRDGEDFLTCNVQELVNEMVQFILSTPQEEVERRKREARACFCAFFERVAWLNNAPFWQYYEWSAEQGRKAFVKGFEQLVALAEAGLVGKARVLPDRRRASEWLAEYDLPHINDIDFSQEWFTAEEVLVTVRDAKKNGASLKFPDTLDGVRRYLEKASEGKPTRRRRIN